MTRETERRFASTRPEQSKAAERAIAEFLLTKAPLLYILMKACKVNGLSEVPAWAMLGALAWLLAVIRDRTGDIVLRADELVDPRDTNRHPFGRMTSPPELSARCCSARTRDAPRSRSVSFPRRPARNCSPT